MTTEEKILEIINDELNAHNQSMPSLIARENIATKINFLFEQEFSEQKPDLNNQIDDIEKEDFLNIIFNELQKDAYDAEYHTYDFKRTNQIIREYFEEYAQQFQKPEINLRDELIKFCEEYKSYYHSIIHLSMIEETDYEKFINDYLKQTKEMKTKEEILIKYDYSDDELGDRLPYKDVNRDRWYHIDDILSAMDEYASLRESKWRELYEAQKEYRVLCKEESDGLIELAYVHGWRAKDEDIKKGEQLRQKITLLEQELGLTVKK